MGLVKSSNEIITQMMRMEEYEKNPEQFEKEAEKLDDEDDDEKKMKKKSEGAQMSAEEKATSSSDGEEIDLGKEESNVKEQEAMMKDFERMKKEQKTEVKIEKEIDPMQQLFDDLFTKIGNLLFIF